MRKFDTKVQYLKYKVLREVAKQAWADTGVATTDKNGKIRPLLDIQL